MNEYLHGVWQEVTSLSVVEDYIEAFDVKFHMWRESTNIQNIAVFSIRFLDTAPSSVPTFDIILPGPLSRTKVQTTFYATHERDGETFYSPGFAEVDNAVIHVRAFPFRADYVYHFNFSFFYISAQ
jgi:hypothetical protein